MACDALALEPFSATKDAFSFQVTDPDGLSAPGTFTIELGIGFSENVNPIFSNNILSDTNRTCSASTCHGKIKDGTVVGKDGFALSSGDSDQNKLANYKELTTEELKGENGSGFMDGQRIINRSNPAASALLVKAASMSKAVHGGSKNGRLINEDGNSFRIIERWIDDGCPGPDELPDDQNHCVQ